MASGRGTTYATRLRWWERTAIALFGLVLMGGVRGADRPVRVAFLVAGALVVAAAVGLIDVAMALWYRRRRPDR